MTHKLLDAVLKGLANPLIHLAIVKGDIAAIKNHLRTGTSPIAMASDWFTNPIYDREMKLLALKGLIQQVRMSGLEPDDPLLSCGSVSLLAAATELGAFEDIVYLVSMGADPLKIVDSLNPNPRARTIIGNAMTAAMGKPEIWLSFYMAFGSFAEAYHYQMGHFQYRSTMDSAPL